jgi:hypothetical protein
MTKEYASLRRRPFLTPLWLWMWSSAAVILLVGASLWLVRDAPTTLLVLVAVPEASANLPAARINELFRTVAGTSLAAVVADPAVKSSGETLAAALHAPLATLDSNGTDLRSVAARYRGQKLLVLVAPAELPALIDRYAPGAPPANAYLVAVPRFSRLALLPLSLP